MYGRFPFMDTVVDAVTLQDLNQGILAAVRQGRRLVVAHHNLHSLYLVQHDRALRDFFASSDIVHLDGMALVYLCRLAGIPMRRAHRTTYVDWIKPLLNMAEHHDFRVFYLGATRESLLEGLANIRKEFPALSVDGVHGYFEAGTPPFTDAEVLLRIQRFGPHILLVGTGMPRQELWVAEHQEDISANAVLTAGGCMDYIAGTVPTPPRWAGQVGMEWLFRLCAEPGRLWRRYLVEPWLLLLIRARRRLSAGGSW